MKKTSYFKTKKMQQQVQRVYGGKSIRKITAEQLAQLVEYEKEEV